MASPITALNRKVTLPALSWRIVKEILNAPGWASTPRQIIVSGRIDSSDLLALPPTPKPIPPATALTKEQDEKWCSKPVTVELSDKQVEVIKECLKHFITQKAVPTGKYGLALVEAFLGDEE